MRLLILDNYDSFTYNLVEMIRQQSSIPFDVVSSDRIDLQSIEAYDKILISPGPGLPFQAGLSCEIIRQYAASKDILGICLGHQAIAEVFGAYLFNLEEVYHGKSVELKLVLPDFYLFEGLPSVIAVGLYHSWAVSGENLPSSLQTTALSTDGIIMGLKHKAYKVCGLQFHPESIMTPLGGRMMKNWLR